MKGQAKIVREAVETAYREGIGRIQEYHVRVLRAMTSGDFVEIQRSGRLESERQGDLTTLSNSTPDETRETVSMVATLLHGESDEELRRSGIRITRGGDGIQMVEYDE